MSIHIKPGNRGKFTRKAKAAGKGVQEYASQVLNAPEGQYPASTRRQANFARNAAGWQKKNVGGPLAPAPSGAPGGASGAIQAYLNADPASAVQSSYVPGAVAADQEANIAYQKNLREAQEAGIDNPEQIVYRDWVEDTGGGDQGWDSWNQTQRDRYLTHGSPGVLIHKDDRNPWQRGVHFASDKEGSVLTNQMFLDEMAKRDEGGIKVPGVMSGLAGGIGGAMRAKMRAAVEAGGTPVATGQGQFAVINPDGSIIGNTGALGVHGLRKHAVDQGIIEAPKNTGIFSNFFGSVADAIGLKTAEERRIAEEQAAQQAAHQAAIDALVAQQQGSGGGQHWTSDLSESDNQAISHTISSNADLFSAEDFISDDDAGNAGAIVTKDGLKLPGFNVGGMAMRDDVWAMDPLAVSIETKDFGQARGPVAAPQVVTSSNPLMELGTTLATKAATGYIMPGSLGGATDSGWLGLNEGGEAEKKKRTIWGLAEKAGVGDKVEKYRGKDGNITLQLNAGGWVGKRTAYLVNGGMAQPQAEMQAYNEMQGMTGPTPVGADFMMPPGSPAPEQYTPENNFGYVPSGGKTYKEQMEADKVKIQRAQAMDKEDRDNRAFDAAERRKDEAHKLALTQKQESHQESMRQKKAGPLAGG